MFPDPRVNNIVKSTWYILLAVKKYYSFNIYDNCIVQHFATYIFDNDCARIDEYGYSKQAFQRSPELHIFNVG